jgi:methyl-accepting chemotaxis protein
MKGEKEMKLTISTKLILGFLFVSFITAVVGFLGITNVQKVGKAADVILDEEVPVADAAMECTIALIEARDAAAEYLLETDLDALSEFEDSFHDFCTDFDIWADGIVEGSNELGIIETDNVEIKRMIKKAQELHKKFEDASDKMMQAHAEAMKQESITLNASEQIARSFMKEMDKFGEETHDLLDVIEELAGEEMQAAMEVADNVETSSRATLILFTISGIILGMAIGILVSQSITRPALKAITVAQKIANNDLTVRKLEVRSKDEIGDLGNALDTMTEKLQQIISQIKDNTEQVAAAATDISSTSAELASGAEEQTNQSQEVANSMQEMAASIVQSSQNAAETAKIAETAGTRAKAGSDAMKMTRQGMEEIVAATGKTAEIINSLSSRADQIGEIIQVIDEIADQTNLLALNAAIEAARAGEKGRGFAVVADEVRKLAERTSSSTKEISETIKAIQNETKDASQSMSEANKVVTAGSEATIKTENVLSEILESVVQAVDMTQQISAAAEEQSSGAEEVSSSIESINAVTKQSAGGAERMASAAEELNSQTEALRNVVHQFKLNGKELQN